MAYRANWLAHLLAPITGRGFDDRLARDFWSHSEDLWDGKKEVSLRWLKLFLAYFASGIAQLVAPVALVGLVIVPIRHGVWLWYWLAIGAAVLIGLIGALISATGAHISALRESPAGRSTLQQTGAAVPKVLGAIVLLCVAGFYLKLLLFGAPR
jgi:hypothetical protein